MFTFRSGLGHWPALCVALAMLGSSGRIGAATESKQYEVEGIVRAPLSAEGELMVEHEDVPGLMPSMTMPFKPQDRAEAAGLEPGDGVAFTLVISDAGATIARIRKIDPASVSLPTPPPQSGANGTIKRVKEGDTWPAFELVDQNGKSIAPADFAGNYTLLNFIFTRCAVPDYCPLMTRNFVEIKSALGAETGAGKVRLLSVSFDPEDTPEVLRQYAEAKGAGWTFATGEPGEIDKLTKAFAVRVEQEGGTYNHGLCTALVGPDGKILQLWRGNAWKPQEVTEAVRAALQSSNN